MWKIKNISNNPRKFRIHKTAEAFFIREGETLEVPFKPIVSNPSIFKVQEIKLEEKPRKVKKSELNMEDKK